MRMLLFASAAIVAAAAAAPHLLAPHLQSVRQEAAAQPEAPAPQRAVAGRQVAIAATADGHFYVEAEINFRPVRLMVDTGASVIALRQSDAAAAGIRPLPADFAVPVQTANGTTQAAEAQLDRVSVADIEVAGVRALVIPDAQLAVSLLGASFLNRLARFQVADGTLVFEN